jgi:hypothetical protein
MAKHQCPNRFHGEGARGGCYFEIEASENESKALVRVGWSCVTVQDGEIPVTWLAEVLAIATGHKNGIAGFLAEHNYGGGYALQCDPPKAGLKP